MPSSSDSGDSSPPGFLTSVFSLPPASSFLSSSPEKVEPRLACPDPTRPYVTLTFAESLDGKIAGKQGRQLALSGRESLIMTHWMRTMHDGILVGIGTALNDDPQLNTRHLPPTTSLQYRLPRPIILDSGLRLSVDCKLLQNYRNGRGRKPWVICSREVKQCHLSEKINSLERAGARVIPVDSDDDGQLSISAILQVLRKMGIESLMVEGGAAVIGSFLNTSTCIDTLIITVAPTLVGGDGVSYGSQLRGNQVPHLRHVRSEIVGQDTVVALQFQ